MTDNDIASMFGMNTPLHVKLLSETAQMPTRGSRGSAGYDLYADITDSVVIYPHETIKIPTGIAIALPQNTYGAIYARSGLATKHGIAPANKVGVIDQDYRGEIIVALHNHSNTPYTLYPVDRIAQLLVCPYVPVELAQVDELDATERAAGGFGSTGV